MVHKFDQNWGVCLEKEIFVEQEIRRYKKETKYLKKKKEKVTINVFSSPKRENTIFYRQNLLNNVENVLVLFKEQIVWMMYLQDIYPLIKNLLISGN